MCDPVQQMAAIAERTIAREEHVFIPELRAIVARLEESISVQQHELHVARTALTNLLIRQQKAEADQ